MTDTTAQAGATAQNAATTQAGAAPQGRTRLQVYLKIGFLLLLVLGSLIPLEMVRGLVLERQGLSFSVKQEVSATWGRDQQIIGPVLTVPFQEKRVVQVRNPKKDAEPAFVEKVVFDDHRLHLLPEVLDIDAEAASSVRRRGIYEVPLYTARTRFSGSFGRPDLEALGIGPEDKVLWDKARIEVYVTDLSGSLNAISLTWDGRELPFRLDAAAVAGASRIVAPLAGLRPDRGAVSDFAFDVDLNGSGSFGVLPLGKTTEMSLTSSWPHPGFTGGALPSDAEISAQGFTADWQVSHFARQIPQQWRSDLMPVETLVQQAYDKGLLTRLVEPVDHYLKAERSVKYGVLFVVLVCTLLFGFEVMAGGRVHFVQYGLIVAALCIFFLLLLSLSEILGFAAAYAIAAALSVTLVALYVAKVAGGWRRGGLVTGLLAGIYGYLYITLQSEDHAMMMGSLLLFAALAALMFATRNVDWYGLGAEVQRRAPISQAGRSDQA